MIQCSQCELCVTDDAGRMQFKCNPFSNIKEPECLQKWLVLKTDLLLRGQQAMLNYSSKFAPLQEKMFKFLEREIDDASEADKWKQDEDEDDDSDQSY